MIGTAPKYANKSLPTQTTGLDVPIYASFLVDYNWWCAASSDFILKNDEVCHRVWGILFIYSIKVAVWFFGAFKMTLFLYFRYFILVNYDIKHIKHLVSKKFQIIFHSITFDFLVTSKPNINIPKLCLSQSIFVIN